MNFQILYWHWLVFGMVLAMAEIFIPSFTLFWFGLGAVVVCGALLLYPTLALSWQLLVWILASIAFTVLWFKFIRPLMADRTKAGISREAIIGESGRVIKTPFDDTRGVVRFATPVLGSDEWSFICEDPVALGDRVVVKEVSGNTLIVEK
jgi:membrane protein implicated in regulation of membrane protease activity